MHFILKTTVITQIKNVTKQRLLQPKIENGYKFIVTFFILYTGVDIYSVRKTGLRNLQFEK